MIPDFLRLRLAEDGFDVFAIGLEEVPRRDDWLANLMHKPGAPDPLQTELVPEGRSQIASHLKGVRPVRRIAQRRRPAQNIARSAKPCQN
jgi:hypothetical protein